MGCPTTTITVSTLSGLSAIPCVTPSQIFAGVYNPFCGGFGDPSNFQAEQEVFRQTFEELINNFGVDVNYYINGFNYLEMNMLYGEHPLQVYAGPIIIKAYVELEEILNLSQFGYEADDALTFYVSINTFSTTMSVSAAFYAANNQRIEPKADDLVEITSLGCDRPGNRGPKIFRITEALDQSVQDGINPMMGHYVWKITAKRYETSHETNAPQELGNDQVYDNTFAGKLSSILFPTLSTDPKVYPDNVDDLSRNTVYDMDNVDNSIYGTYY